MATYFLSDVHLRLDRPERGFRLKALIDQLESHNTVVIAGDLCDFWFASRQQSSNLLDCPGLRSLQQYRQRGGQLVLLAGNHDQWLGPVYEQLLKTSFTPEPWMIETFGYQIHVVHGHRLGGRTMWKELMESRFFLDSYRRLPLPIATRLAKKLEESNSKTLEAAHRRHLAVYQQFVETQQRTRKIDAYLFGHVHDVYDLRISGTRLIVLGDWLQGSSVLRVDPSGLHFNVERS